MLNPGDSDNARLLDVIRELKHSTAQDIIIEGQFKGMPYELLLITMRHSGDHELIRLLSRWRKQHEWWFPAQFNVTEEGTAKWLRNQVIDTPDRLLFMIRAGSEHLGHVGLFRFNLEEKNCEIDNIVRGEQKIPGIMGDAIVNMMQWGKQVLGLRAYELQTFSDNRRSLALYHRLGFTEVRRVPLIAVKSDDRVDWVDAPQGHEGPVERYNVFMNLPDHSAI
jgi:RimJ/RimL family protein N-acetyltransferase